MNGLHAAPARAALVAIVAGLAGAVAAQADPAFSLQATPPGLSPGGFMAALAVGDLDGDGDIDAVAGGADGTLRFLRNDAGPAAPPSFVVAGPVGGATSFASTPALADLDGDGDLDLLVGQGDGAFRYYQNTASPTTAPVFAAPVINPFGLTDVGSNSAPWAADIDGDGDVDVFSGRTDGTVAYFENTAGVGAAPALIQRTGPANPLATADVGWSSIPSLADPDGDGDMDVVVGDVLGNLTLFRNMGGPSGIPIFAAPVANPFGLSDIGFGSVPAIADLDRDGDLDLVAGRSVGTAAYFVNGAPNPLAVRLVGAEGWRMLTSAIGNVSVGSFLGPIWTQGVPGADNPGGQPNVLRYDETVTTDTNGDGGNDQDDGFVAPSNMSEPSGPGRGMLVYVYEDDDMVTPGTQGGFPKTLSVSGVPRTTRFRWAGAGGDATLTFTSTGVVAHDGWNLLGNPFASWFDWDATTSTGMDAVVYVFDPSIASYRSHSRGVGGTLPGGVVGAFQAFWVHATATPAELVAPPAPADGGPVYGLTIEQPARVRLSLHPDQGMDDLPEGVTSEVLLALGVEGAAAGRDGLDAYALGPPAQSFVYLATRVEGEDEAIPLSIDVRPLPTSVQEIPLAIAAVTAGAPASGPLVLRWPAPESLPEGMTISLVDREAGTEVDLVDAGSYRFVLAAPRSGQPAIRRDVARVGLAPMTLRVPGDSSRFALMVEPGATTGNGPAAPADLALTPASPNPASAHTSLVLSLPAASYVSVELLDALGRRVALLLDGSLPAGRHPMSANVSRLRAGAYVVVARVAGEAPLMRRITVVK